MSDGVFKEMHTMKRRWILFVSIVLFQTILMGCVSKTAQLPEECLAVNMLINGDDISAFNSESEGLSPIPDDQANSAINTFIAGSGIATHRLALYDGCGEEMYHKTLEFRFRVEKEDETWELPDINFKSNNADEFEYACITRRYGVENISEEVKCEYVGRYQDYVVVLWMITDPGDFDLDDFTSGMAAIDREVAECFAALKEDR